MGEAQERGFSLTQEMAVMPLRPGIYGKAALAEIGVATDRSEAILAEAERWRAIARATFRKAREDGFASGLADGLDTAQGVVAQLRTAAQDEAQARTTMARDMAETVLRQIIDDMDPGTRVEAALRRVQKSFEGAQFFSLTVNPAEIEALRGLDAGSPVAGLTLTADPTVRAGHAVLKTNMGQIDLSLERSLERVIGALDTALGQGT
ncbi:FliH/SctL family protein [uncultured Tateyamaria sp.]|uniref:FliH/SctL family protein n=1 Tax=uncultured Tateyamaria sp. TaxID=455651 RepID=UPI00263269B5|nr:FliH/SctL family protein [uncultured Tateyamaria sp.]